MHVVHPAMFGPRSRPSLGRMLQTLQHRAHRLCRGPILCVLVPATSAMRGQQREPGVVQEGEVQQTWCWAAYMLAARLAGQAWRGALFGIGRRFGSTGLAKLDAPPKVYRVHQAQTWFLGNKTLVHATWAATSCEIKLCPMHSRLLEDKERGKLGLGCATAAWI
jgi:hypothetical protein